MKCQNKVVRLYGRWRVLDGAKPRKAVAADWVNLAEWPEYGAHPAAGRPPAPLRAEPGYRVIGEKLILLNLHNTPAPAA